MLLPQRVGMAQANALFYLGKELSAGDAVRLGLANEMVPSGQASQAAVAAAHAVAASCFGGADEGADASPVQVDRGPDPCRMRGVHALCLKLRDGGNPEGNRPARASAAKG